MDCKVTSQFCTESQLHNTISLKGKVEILADLKEFNSVEITEFATGQDIVHRPNFGRWVPFTLKKRGRSIQTVSSRFNKNTHNYVVEMPDNIVHAKQVDIQHYGKQHRHIMIYFPYHHVTDNIQVKSEYRLSMETTKKLVSPYKIQAVLELR